MENRNDLLIKANKHAAQAWCAFSDEAHMRELNAWEKLWTEWCSLEDVDIIGDLSLHKIRPRKPITWSFSDYGYEECLLCHENAHGYYDEMMLKCPHCGNQWEVELDENGNEIFIYVGEYNYWEQFGITPEEADCYIDQVEKLNLIEEWRVYKNYYVIPKNGEIPYDIANAITGLYYFD